MQSVHCPRCNKKLCYIEYGHITIKCPRCKFITDQNTQSVHTGNNSNAKEINAPQQ
ncbi:Com family DNA-binding transcriptional regulator [Shewanella sp. D64]|uniref:Com family DNA-binding transcriptional regulator n=1 Tax=unclassified Shewanella TaxID=196818 RepID=UPI002DD70070|nr:Com family DNA-binding transcriptional regulator [Shewanella sp. D64]MEC4737203.1 Com family DNA-binding transcriptional regulator [Shewanella sp. E94]WBJ93582.1 Com family DNA-binding transcriptional regulator [Shewanella sp. MTB7]